MQEFDKINKDYLEEDLKISEDNTFLLVMDKNLKGEASVGNLLPKECVIDWDIKYIIGN